MNRPPPSMKYRVDSWLGALVLTLLASRAPAQPMAQARQPDSVRWTDAAAELTLIYPRGWRRDEQYVYNGLGPSKPLYGVSIDVPASLTRGTTLQANGTGIAILTLPAQSRCTAARFLATQRIAHTLIEGGRRWSVAFAQEAGAGNRYLTRVFARKHGGRCVAVLYRIHATAAGNYPKGAVRPYDEHALLARFDRIRRSITFGLQGRQSPAARSAQPPAAPQPAAPVSGPKGSGP